MSASIRWPTEAILDAVAPQLPGFSIEILPTVDSTNSELMRRARAGRFEPLLLVAEQQTAGRGRLGRVWHSAPGDSLMFSLGLPLAPQDWSGLSLAVGVSIAESLQPILPPLSPTSPTSPSTIPRIGLKWPNDLWLTGGAIRDERKLGGILVETASFVAHSAALPMAMALASARYVVVGVGLNIRPQDSAGKSLPPGCLHEVDAATDAASTLLRVVAPLVLMLQSFEVYGFAPIQARFGVRDVLHNRNVSLNDGQTGTAHGVGEEGALLVMTAHGMRTITSSEVSVRPAGAASTGP